MRNNDGYRKRIVGYKSDWNDQHLLTIKWFDCFICLYLLIFILI